MAIFCTNKTENDVFGDTVEGFSTSVFCNKTKYVQTDVGICVANDPVQYWYDGKVIGQATESTIEKGLRNAEHLIILSVDKFENPDGFSVWLIVFLCYLEYFQNRSTFSDNDAKDKSQKRWLTNASTRR